MISVFGMNEKVGNVSFLGMQDQFHKPYSDETASLIDTEVRKLIESQYKRAIALLKEKRNELEILANSLLENEVLLKSDVERLIGRRPSDAIPKAEKEAAEKDAAEKEAADKGTSSSDLPEGSVKEESSEKE